MRENLEEMWADVWSQHVSATETKSGINADDWRVGGRRTKALPDGETLAHWQSEGLSQVEDYLAWFANTGWSIATMPDGRPGIEWDAIVEFGGTPVKLIIDCIYSNGDDLIIVDYKTGRMSPTGQQQLALYASAVERIHGVRPKWGSFYMTRTAALADLTDLTPWSMEFFDYQFASMNAFLDTGFYPANIDKHCESMCSVKDYCHATNGPLSSGYNPLRKEDR